MEIKRQIIESDMPPTNKNVWWYDSNTDSLMRYDSGKYEPIIIKNNSIPDETDDVIIKYTTIDGMPINTSLIARKICKETIQDGDTFVCKYDSDLLSGNASIVLEDNHRILTIELDSRLEFYMKGYSNLESLTCGIQQHGSVTLEDMPYLEKLILLSADKSKSSSWTLKNCPKLKIISVPGERKDIPIKITVSGENDSLICIYRGDMESYLNGPVSFEDDNLGGLGIDTTNSTSPLVECQIGDRTVQESELIITSSIIPRSSFRHFTNLSTIHLGNVEIIGMTAFQNCTSLSEVSFSEYGSAFEYPTAPLKVIHNAAFRTCSMLEAIYLPEALEDIRQFAFLDCTSLNTVMLFSPHVVNLEDVNAFQNCSEDLQIYVRHELVDEYKQSTNWSALSDKIQGFDPTEIASYKLKRQ